MGTGTVYLIFIRKTALKDLFPVLFSITVLIFTKVPQKTVKQHTRKLI
jgi:hypothetical protein